MLPPILYEQAMCFKNQKRRLKREIFPSHHIPRHRLPELAGGHAGDLFERAVEGRQAREPGIKRDVNDMHIRLAEHPLRAFDAFLGQKGHERRVGVAFEQVGKVGFTHAHLRGHILQRQRLGAVLRNVQTGFGHAFDLLLLGAGLAGRVGLLFFEAAAAHALKKLQQQRVHAHLPERRLRLVLGRKLFQQHQQPVRLAACAVIADVRVAGKQPRLVAQLVHDREQLVGELDDQIRVRAAALNAVQIAGVQQQDIVDAKLIPAEIDADGVAFGQADQYLHKRVPVQLVHIIGVDGMRHIELGALRKADGFKIFVEQYANSSASGVLRPGARRGGQAVFFDILLCEHKKCNI